MSKVSELLVLLNPEDAQTFKTMYTRQGFTEDAPIDEVLAVLLPADMTHQEGLMLCSVVNIKNGVGKFSPKLNFIQRCEVLALHRKGFTRDVIANLYKIDKRTVTHIYNPLSPHYRNVREEEQKLGPDRFITTYLKDRTIREALAFVEADKAGQNKETNNVKANRKAGIHNMRNDMCQYEHRVVIKWCRINEYPNIEVSGWYYRDLDSQWPDDWFTAGGPESLKTSQAAYDAAQKDISDKIP